MLFVLLLVFCAVNPHTRARHREEEAKKARDWSNHLKQQTAEREAASASGSSSNHNPSPQYERPKAEYLLIQAINAMGFVGGRTECLAWMETLIGVTNNKRLQSLMAFGYGDFSFLDTAFVDAREAMEIERIVNENMSPKGKASTCYYFFKDHNKYASDFKAIYHWKRAETYSTPYRWRNKEALNGEYGKYAQQWQIIAQDMYGQKDELMLAERNEVTARSRQKAIEGMADTLRVEILEINKAEELKDLATSYRYKLTGNELDDVVQVRYADIRQCKYINHSMSEDVKIQVLKVLKQKFMKLKPDCLSVYFLFLNDLNKDDFKTHLKAVYKELQNNFFLYVQWLKDNRNDSIQAITRCKSNQDLFYDALEQRNSRRLFMLMTQRNLAMICSDLSGSFRSMSLRSPSSFSFRSNSLMSTKDSKF